MRDLKLFADLGKTKYLEVYPGAPNPIPAHYYSISNPVIQYQQGEEMSCAFFQWPVYYIIWDIILYQIIY
jgi:hypothetical protein